MHGVTKPIKVDASYLGKIKNPMAEKGDKAAFQGTTTINRKDFGVSYGPDAIVSDKVKLTIDLEADSADTKMKQ
jgi:polyisoprenoid-binding protein YceI